LSAAGQRPNILSGATDRIPRLGGGGGGGQSGGNDSLRSRYLAEDTINISYYILDSTRSSRMDSSISDYFTRFPIPPTHVYLGNTGAPTRSILFAPSLRAGFDPGFHALDVYKWSLEKVRFFNTTRPYTELNYSLASRAEQIIEVMHTQNLKPYWNASFQYRLTNAPGVFRNQKTNHNNYLLTSWYQSPSKRYNNYLVVVANKLQSEQNGGIKNDKNYLADPIYADDRFTIPTKIGGDPVFGTNFFNSVINTGIQNSETNILLRQQYDLGRKDSIVTDSTVLPLFFPRLRFEHNFKYGNYNYSFRDFPVRSATQNNVPDSAYYFDHYGITMSTGDSVFFQDRWKEFSNDFSIYQFPDPNNLQQFIKLGMELQLLRGQVRTNRSLYNLSAHGEYRNRTKNQKWDMMASGRLFLNGYNAGDYHANVNLLRQLGRFGNLQVGFENVNRTPGFIYNQSSNFYLDALKDFNKENTIHLYAAIGQPGTGWQLRGDYYLITNYLYLTDFYKLEQESTLFNVLRVNALKTFRVGRHWRWHTEIYLQQKIGDAPLNIPALFTRNRFAYEGNLGFRHLTMALGTEVRAHTPYKADNFSPVLQQFFFQNTTTITNLPQVDLYLNFRIRSFKAYLRVENLNTMSFTNGFGFTNHNFAAPEYPLPGMMIRLGIFWSFVN
jgi:hypothetical protein